MAQYHDAPEQYLALIRSQLPLYDRLQEELARATEGVEAERVLDLGVGTGETSRRCLERHPGAALTGIDRSEQMVEIARDVVGDGADLRVAALEERLPDGPFDLVISALAVHHLDRAGKADLFERVRALLAPSGRFVMADVVVPATPVERPAPMDPMVDKPDRLDDQLEWLRQARLAPTVTWAEEDLAVVAADAV